MKTFHYYGYTVTVLEQGTKWRVTFAKGTPEEMAAWMPLFRTPQTWEGATFFVPNNNYFPDEHSAYLHCGDDANKHILYAA